MSLQIRSFIGLFCILLSLESSARLKYQHRWEVSGTAQYRELNQNGFSELQNQTDGFFLLALEQTATWKKWAFEIRPELRALTSPSLETNETDLSRISLRDRTRALDFYYQVSPEQDSTETNHLIVTDIEKLNFRYQGSSFEFLAGRNPYNPSIMRLSPIWNKFGKDIFYTGYPNFQFNPDITSLKWQGDSFWIQNANVYGKEPEQTAYLLLMGLNFDSIETQLLVGNWWRQKAFGGNISLSTEESLWKAEALYVQSEEPLPSHTQGALGFERSWTESFSTVSEVILSNLPDQYADAKQITLGASPFSRLRSKYYFATEMSYQISDFWLASATPVINLEDSSSIFVLSLKGNLSDNFETTASARFGVGPDDSEFSSNSVSFPNSKYLGYNNTVFLMMRYFFQ